MVSDSSFAACAAKQLSRCAWQSSEILGLMGIENPVLRSVMGLHLFAEAIAFQDGRAPTASFFEAVILPFKQGDIASLCDVSRTITPGCLQKLATATGSSFTLVRLSWNTSKHGPALRAAVAYS
jgi:hypothetical protein